ncbi:MAG: mobile mystery protein B [Armatimonadetes bacterium]|nr:mobile mystery protein B [Armatimonadota bacterium]
MGIDFSWPDGATPIDPEDLAGLIPSITTQAELNEFEARNILEAIIWAESSRKIKQSLLDQSTLRLLHARMFGRTWKWAGKYRQTQKNIGCESWQIPTMMKTLEEDAKTWLQLQTYSPDEIKARFHHRLVWIHPFVNGNGRFARLATDLLCEQQGWPLSAWGSSDLVQPGEARAAYITALRAADGHDFALLIAFIKG